MPMTYEIITNRGSIESKQIQIIKEDAKPLTNQLKGFVEDFTNICFQAKEILDQLLKTNNKPIKAGICVEFYKSGILKNATPCKDNANPTS